MSIQDLQNELYEKAEAEQQQYLADMKTKPPEEIIKAAYKITMREEILSAFNEQFTFLNEKQLKALLKKDCPIAACYDDWQNSTGLDMQALQDCISDYADDLVKAEAEKANKRKQEPER